MNEQNNNFNSQFNNQPNSSNFGGQPTQPVKNRFFSPDLFNDSSVNDVGSSTSSNVNNNVISWGVGQKKAGNPDSQSISNNVFNNQADNFVSSEQLLEQVNGDVYEVLDDEFLMGDVSNGSALQSPTNNEVLDIQSSPLFQEANNNIVNQQQNSYVNQNQYIQSQPVQPQTVQVQQVQSQPQYNQQIMQAPMTQGQFVQQPQQFSQQPPVQQPVIQQPAVQQPVVQPVNNIQNQTWKEGIGVVQPVGDDWMQHQPLSASSLGVGAINNEELTKDVVEESKFFNPNINAIVEQNEQEQKQQFAMQYGSGQGVILDDPTPDIDDNALLRQYVGASFQKISMSPFSFPALILSGIYFMYRK
ncbi:MAG: hypothetical protein K2H20_01460, partial [Bacilli bacterium]|nr:hypothetical protein [Bacilli bacterium]